jgi:hypothetical protein
MTLEDIQKSIDAIEKHGHGGWLTPSGAFLDLLREFARDSKLKEISEACKLYFAAYPGTCVFVSSALPAIIVNCYPPFTDTVDFTDFLKWSNKNGDWAERISSSASAPVLVSEIEGIVSSVRQFADKK